MKHAFATLCIVHCALFIAASAASAPVATVTATSQDAGTRMVEVTFDLSEPAIVTLGAQVRTGGGDWVDIDGSVIHVTGDANRPLPAGTGYKAIWNADRDWPGHPADGETVRMAVRCWSEGNPPPYFVMSCEDTSKRWYYTDERQITGGVTNRLYKTDYLVMRRVFAKNVVWPMGSPSTETGRSSNETQHWVKLTNDYYMAVFPATKRQGILLFGKTDGYANRSVAWLPADAASFTALRGATASGAEPPDAGSALAALRTSTGLRFDLPSEAQWEYACRAGTGSARPFGDGVLTDFIWYSGNNVNNGVNRQNGDTHEPGLFPPNAWGFYDMLGNVTEWCRDWFGDYVAAADQSSPLVAPTGPEAASDSNNDRVKRGGAYISGENLCRSAKRCKNYQTYALDTNNANGSGTFYSNGYRLIVELD